MTPDRDATAHIGVQLSVPGDADGEHNLDHSRLEREDVCVSGSGPESFKSIRVYVPCLWELPF